MVGTSVQYNGVEIGLLTITGTPTSFGPGVPGSQTLIEGLGDGMRSGGRFVAGGWLDSGRTVGLEGDYFFLASRTAARVPRARSG